MWRVTFSPSTCAPRARPSSKRPGCGWRRCGAGIPAVGGGTARAWGAGRPGGGGPLRGRPTPRGGGGGSAVVNRQGEVFEANVGDVEPEGLPRLQGPSGSSAQVLQMHGLLQPVFESLGLRLQGLELTGRGGWRATLDNEAVVELGGGSAPQVLQRTQRFTRTL